ncbi:hypothetical protein JCM24511_10171 [Saitozyma sp. JCM 24511]|nr:hypothetical protein JCM24511_10171 [Saitozyma sp. JCM 24511]
MILPSVRSRRQITLSLSLGMFMVIMTFAAGYSTFYATESLLDPRAALPHTFNADVCRTAPGLPHNAPSREELLELRERTRAAFPLSDSHARLYDEFIATSRTRRQMYNKAVRDRLGYTGMENCGTWPEDYARMHWESQEAGKQMGDPGAPKRIVHVALTRNGQNGGLGDRTLGQITSFMVALLLNRPWHAYWDWDSPLPIEAVWHSPYIDWTLPTSPDPILPGDETTKWTHKLRTSGELEQILLKNKFESRHALDEYLEEEVGTYQSNYGSLIQTMYDWDSWESRTLREMGMTSENAWRCVSNFLFQPLPDTKLAIAYYHGLVAHPEIFSVAIQIRTGDGNLLDQPSPFDPDALNLKHWAKGQLQCAADLALAYAKPQHKRVVFFISTDLDPGDPPRARKRSYWNVTTTGYLFLACSRGLTGRVGTGHNTLHDYKKQYAVQGTVLDNFVFESCDWKLLDVGSGFGLIAHYRSYKEDSAYFLHRGWEIPPVQYREQKCGSPEANFTLQQIVAGMKGG